MKALKTNFVGSDGEGQGTLAKGVGLVVRSADDTSPDPDWMSVETAAAMFDAQKILSAGLVGNQAAMQAMAGNQAAMQAMMAGNSAGMQMAVAPSNQVTTGEVRADQVAPEPEKDLTAKLQELAKLKADGMLDDDEFKQAKAKLLAQS